MTTVLERTVPDERRDRDTRVSVALQHIEERLGSIEHQLKEINGTVRRHDHELYGPSGRGGIVEKAKELTDRMETLLVQAKAMESKEGMVPARTLWAGIASIAAVASVIVAMVVGLS